jgi:hypothetical protein
VAAQPFLVLNRPGDEEATVDDTRAPGGRRRTRAVETWSDVLAPESICSLHFEIHI